MVVYIDVLIILNLYINFFLIKATALVMRRDISAKRCVLAALIGALGALVMLLPELPLALTFLIKLVIGGITTFASFGRQPPRDFAVCALFFLVISFTFAGVMMALWTFVSPFGMVWSNGTAYFNIPIAALAAFTAAAYFIVKLIRMFADKRLRCNKICKVNVKANGGEAELFGLADTGNEMCDIFSGRPVMICDFSKSLPIIPQNVISYFNEREQLTPCGQILPNEREQTEMIEGIKLIPCSTVSGSALIPVFKAEQITIDGKEADALIGISKQPLGDGVDCVFNPKIISI